MLPARYIKPTGPQSKALWSALKGSISRQDLEMLLMFEFEKELDHIASTAKPYDGIVFDVINTARREGWLARLIAGALERNPHPDLYAVAQDLGLTAASKEQESNFERIVTEKSQFHDIRPWLSKFVQIESQVCRVETPSAKGTGFLISPDVVVTNYHVMKSVIDAPATAPQVVLRFDYKVIEDNAEQEVIHKGTTFRLSDDWLIDHSPYSAADTLADPPQPPSPEELDYAILRVAGEPGRAPAGGQAAPGARERGWISMPDAAQNVETGDMGFILQHPKAAPLKLAFGTITAVNANRTRIRYETSTEHGSSGSPVFDLNLNLLALHHAGDPDYSRLALYNQGVLFTPILALLEDRGKRDSISANEQ